MLTSIYKFYDIEYRYDEMSFVCSQPLHDGWLIFTDLGFIFTTVMSQAETVGDAKSHNMATST